MSIDSAKPVFFRVSIDPAGLGGAAPADGFIDAVSPDAYISIIEYTGTEANPTVSDGDSIKINGISITFTTAGGLNLAGIVSTINALTDQHHVVASASGSNELVLANDILFEGRQFSVQGDTDVLEDLGYVAPVQTTVPGTYPTNLAASVTKERENIRWESIIENLSFDATPYYVGAISQPGADPDNEATVFDFTVAYHLPGHVYTNDEDNVGEILEGIPAITRMVARALATTKTKRRDVLNPDNDTNSNIIGPVIMDVTSGALAADIATGEANITVTAIANTR